jgi:hypothetical protein
LWKPWRQKGSGEEILTRDAPLTRYGVGVLYPIGVSSEIGEGEEQVSTELDGKRQTVYTSLSIYL